MSRIDVTIDRVLLSGIEPERRDALVARLSDGIRRALLEPTRGTPGPRSAPVVRVGELRLEAGPEGARTLGVGIGRAIGRAAR